MSGLPGDYDRYDIDGLRQSLQAYEGLTRNDLRQTFARFWQAVLPATGYLGINPRVHPDDPPRDILGLPRFVSSKADAERIFGAVDSTANGLTLCSGSLGANRAKDVPAFAHHFGDRIHFARLRPVSKDIGGSFEEAALLEGDTDMVSLIDALLMADGIRADQA
jgi:mannonate dehydratase